MGLWNLIAHGSWTLPPKVTRIDGPILLKKDGSYCATVHYDDGSAMDIIGNSYCSTWFTMSGEELYWLGDVVRTLHRRYEFARVKREAGIQ